MPNILLGIVNNSLNMLTHSGHLETSHARLCCSHLWVLDLDMFIFTYMAEVVKSAIDVNSWQVTHQRDIIGVHFVSDTDGGWLVLLLAAGFVHGSFCAGLNTLVNRPQHRTPLLLFKVDLYSCPGTQASFKRCFCRDLTKVHLFYF